MSFGGASGTGGSIKLSVSWNFYLHCIRVEPSPPGQSIIDYAGFNEEFLGVTGQWEAEDVTVSNKLRTTFTRRRGGMGVTTLNDIIPGAFRATILEFLFPRGLTDHGTPQSEGVSLLTSSTVFNRMLPFWSVNDRRRNIQQMHHTSKGYTSSTSQFAFPGM